MKLPRPAVTAVLACFAVGATAAPARVEAKPPLKRAAERLVRHGAPGAIVVVREGAGVRGYAGIRGKVRMTPVARFRIASLTKTFVATVVLQLTGEGRLGLLRSACGDLAAGHAGDAGAVRPRLPGSRMTTTFGSSDYGLGLARAELRCGTVWGHGGYIPGYRTLVMGRPGGGHVAVVMVNVDESGLAASELVRAAEEAACTAN